MGTRNGAKTVELSKMQVTMNKTGHWMVLQHTGGHAT
jgi:hypothetical protein